MTRRREDRDGDVSFMGKAISKGCARGWKEAEMALKRTVSGAAGGQFVRSSGQAVMGAGAGQPF